MRPRTERGTLQALRSRRAEILGVAAEYGASNVRVFGSVDSVYLAYVQENIELVEQYLGDARETA